MGHLYPLAKTAKSALDGAEHAARTRHEAEALAGDAAHIVSLETEWMTVDTDDAEQIMQRADEGVGDGFVQRYEDQAGAPVLAVTYWKLADGEVVRPPAPVPEPDRAVEDTTDDLYFKAGRTRKRRKRKIDPRQLDLFGVAAPEGDPS
ncbi:MAG: hypothetical protein AAGJ29_03645 [Pseudomonadota bacterium]